MIFGYQFLSNDYAGKFEFSLPEMGILTRSSTTQTTSLPNIIKPRVSLSLRKLMPVFGPLK